MSHRATLIHARERGLPGLRRPPQSPPSRRSRSGARPSANDITVSIEALPERPSLEAAWRDLETRAKPSFFQSWTWIGCWLEQSEVRPHLVAARLDGQIVGLGLVCQARLRHVLGPARGLLLHETGDPALDEVFIEYNGFLAEASIEDVVVSACIRRLIAENEARHGALRWNEFHLSGVQEKMRDAIEALGLSFATLWSGL